MAFWRIFRVFLWKNVLFVYFNWLSLTLIFFGCIGILYVYLKSTHNLLRIPESVYEPKSREILVDNFPGNAGDLLYYEPKTLQTDELMDLVRRELQRDIESMVGFNDATQMRMRLEQNCRGNCFAISFEQFPDMTGTTAEGENPMSGNATDRLRFSLSSTTIRISPKKRYVNDKEVAGPKDDDDYIRTGFLTLQHLVDKNYIQLRRTAERSNDFELAISSMPAIEQEALDSQRLIIFGSLFAILFSVLLLATFLVPLVEEKQDGLKEFLVVATPQNFLNGVTFFLVRFILYVVFLSIALVSAWFYNALGIVPLFFIIVLFVLYMLSAMSYAYLISVCFNSVFYAKVGGLLLLTIPYIFYLLNGGLSYGATFFFSTKTFMDGLVVFQTFCNKHRFFGFSDMFEHITESSFQISTIYALLAGQCLLYALLYNYLSCIFPGPGGLRKPYLFFLQASFYHKKQRNEYTTSERGSDAIIIQDLVKKFTTPRGDIKIADRLNMVIKNKQITVLLGHNGVGKTTTLSMIMGSVPKDSGKIIVCSERDVASYRHLIGFCPQHSVFMHYMTCTQHLQFFAQLRGMSSADALKLTNNLLKQLKLDGKAHEHGKNLSGGMKRRLSLGIAISGETKIVVLDEPSSGLDIESRRELWDILLELRKRKAVLVTTHHMEEAEVLGDTICILSNGRLQRTGSPLELKRKVGSGYILKLECSVAYAEEDTMRLLQSFVPTAKVLNIVPPTVLISLPYDFKTQYSAMLAELESAQPTLGISSISISDTSLEDVFLNCAHEDDQVDGPVDKRKENIVQREHYKRLSEPTPIDWSQQFSAVCYKKWIFLQSEWLYSLLMLSLPFLFVGMAVFLMYHTSLVNSEDVLPLSLSQIKDGIVYIRTVPPSNDAAAELERLLRQQIVQQNITAAILQPETAVSQQLIKFQNDDLAHFLQNVIGVIELDTSVVNDMKINIFYSGNIYHSSVILVNLVDNAMLKWSAQNEHSSIDSSYVPLRRFITDVSPTRLEYYAVIVPIGLFFYIFYFVSLPFREHASGFKELQAVPRLTYWFAVFAFDLTLHFALCVVLGGFQLAIMPQALYSLTEQLIIVFSIFFYGCSYLPIIYCFANGCRSISTISTYLLFMLIVSAIMPLITSGSIPAMNYHEAKILLLSLLPDFNLNHQLRVVNENFVLTRRAQAAAAKGGGASSSSQQESLDLGRFYIFAVFVFGAVMSFFITVLENKNRRHALSEKFSCENSCRRVSDEDSPSDKEMDGLVKEQKAFVDNLSDESQSEYPLIVKDLFKSYARKAVVRGLNFAVHKGECFGLLGVNGAGKTSTFEMIAANTCITSGTILIDGIDRLLEETEYRYRFGYCPQNDCLNTFMTAYQMLKYMALLRNVKESDLHEEITYWLKQLDLEKYEHVEIRHYSGGTKRKLNAAMAMIGDPSLVLLDEPTTGVDPVSRRFLWKCIQDFQQRDKTVVLTSHSMDECEQLCNRLAIMADGRFKCLGFVPKLKQLYGSGFTIRIKMRHEDTDSNVDAITEQMKEQFSDCVLRENHAGMLTYFIKNSDHLPWSNVFARTESFFGICRELVEDYSVNESTLEDIFLKFESSHNQSPPISQLEEV